MIDVHSLSAVAGSIDTEIRLRAAFGVELAVVEEGKSNYTNAKTNEPVYDWDEEFDDTGGSLIGESENR